MKRPEPNRTDRHVYIAEFAHAQYLSFLTAKKKSNLHFRKKISCWEEKALFSTEIEAYGNKYPIMNNDFFCHFTSEMWNEVPKGV